MADKRFIKGLFKDTAHIDQPEGSWRYALNAFLNHNDGAVSNEGGNEVAGKLDVPSFSGGIEFYLVVGEIAIDNDRTVLFLKDQRPKTAAFTPFSAIGIFDPKGTATAGYVDRFKLILELDVNSPVSTFTSKNLDLNFSLNHRIEGTFKIDPSAAAAIVPEYIILFPRFEPLFMPDTRRSGLSFKICLIAILVQSAGVPLTE